MTSAGTGTALPRWDMRVVYPGLESAEFEAGFAALVDKIEGLARLFDEIGVGQGDRAAIDAATVADFERVLSAYNDVLRDSDTMEAYLVGFVAVDSRNDLAQAKQSELRQHGAVLAKLGTRFEAWIGSLDLDGLIVWSEAARAHAFPLQQAKVAAAHLMSPAEEELAADLNLSGGMAWEKLHEDLTSQIMVQLEFDGDTRDLPMSEVRTLASNPDRETRRRAYEAEIRAWEAHAVPLAAALNGVKGQVNTLSGRRRWGSPLDEALFQNHIDRETLEAMLEAARASFVDFRRYLKAKAEALGVPALAWHDLFAPVGGQSVAWDYDEAVRFVKEQFGSYSDRMRDLATRAFAEHWIDAEPRPGKVDGGFCIRLRAEESRILVNYTPAYEGVSTLAHELGHAYHNLNESKLTPLQRQHPMTLAETASTFCETIIKRAALARVEPEEQVAILEGSLQDACQVVVDITSRYHFESRVYERRRERELSVDELNGLMLEAQRETYGEGLNQDRLHPYMWAVKGHYYIPDLSFYNFPYMFGLLFGLGLYAHYEAEPEAFKGGYDDLLASTGLDDAASLAGRFGVDIRSPEFWRSSLDVVREDIRRFEALVHG